MLFFVSIHRISFFIIYSAYPDIDDFLLPRTLPLLCCCHYSIDLIRGSLFVGDDPTDLPLVPSITPFYYYFLPVTCCVETSFPYLDLLQALQLENLTSLPHSILH